MKSIASNRWKYATAMAGIVAGATAAIAAGAIVTGAGAAVTGVGAGGTGVGAAGIGAGIAGAGTAAIGVVVIGKIRAGQGRHLPSLSIPVLIGVAIRPGFERSAV